MMAESTQLLIFSSITTWAESSNSNWNSLLMGCLLFLLIGAALVTMYYYKIGKPDERTNAIYLKSTFIMLGAIILGDFILPKEELWTIVFLVKYGVAFFACGIYLALQYHKDFSN